MMFQQIPNQVYGDIYWYVCFLIPMRYFGISTHILVMVIVPHLAIFLEPAW